MQNKTLMRLFLAVLLLFSGCISSSVYQKIERDGSSALQVTADISKSTATVTPAIASDLRKQMQDTCDAVINAKISVSCVVNNNSMMLKRQLAAADGYEFSSQSGLPYNTYTVTVSKFLFNKFIPQKQKDELGVFAAFAQPIDLSEKEKNKALAAKMRQLNISVQYTIEVPGEIAMASTGSNAIVSGSTVTFDLADALASSEPIEIESKELNTTPLLLILLALAIAALAYAFFKSAKTNKKKQK